MTVPALGWEQTGTIPQRTTRMAQGGYLGRPTAAFTTAESPTTGGGAHGVVGYGDLLCSGTTLTIAVAAGGAFISGANAAQGVYYGYNDASQNVTLAAHNTNPRIDLVVLRARDNAEDSSGATSLSLEAITGTPAASPSAPAVPAGALVLARVNVPANSGATTVTDRRRWAAAVGGRVKCRSTERPTGAALELAKEIYEVDTGRMYVYSGSAWIPVWGQWGCALGQTVAQNNVGGTVTVFTFDSESVDTDGYHAASSSSVVIPAGLGGLYAMTVRGIVGSTPSGNWGVSIKINSNTWFSALGVAGNGAFPTVNGIERLVAGDTLIVEGSNVGSTFPVQVAFNVFRIGP